MNESSVLMTTETSTTRIGMFHRGDTCDSHAENGTPWSRANDQSWRDAVANSLMQADVSMTRRIRVMTVAPVLLCVAS